MHLEREKLITQARGRESWPSEREVAASAGSRAQEETRARGTECVGGVLVAAITYVSEILVRFTCTYLKSSYGTVCIRAGLPTGWTPSRSFGLLAWRRVDFGLLVRRNADRIVYGFDIIHVDDYFRVF